MLWIKDNICLSYNLAILYTKRSTCIWWPKTCAEMFIVELFKPNEAKCPLITEWINKLCSMHITKYWITTTIPRLRHAHRHRCTSLHIMLYERSRHTRALAGPGYKFPKACVTLGVRHHCLRWGYSTRKETQMDFAGFWWLLDFDLVPITWSCLLWEYS